MWRKIQEFHIYHLVFSCGQVTGMHGEEWIIASTVCVTAFFNVWVVLFCICRSLQLPFKKICFVWLELLQKIPMQCAQNGSISG